MCELFEAGEQVVVVEEHTVGREWIKNFSVGSATPRTVSLDKGTRAIVIHDQTSGSSSVTCTVIGHQGCFWLLRNESIDVLINYHVILHHIYHLISLHCAQLAPSPGGESISHADHDAHGASSTSPLPSATRVKKVKVSALCVLKNKILNKCIFNAITYASHVYVKITIAYLINIYFT